MISQKQSSKIISKIVLSITVQNKKQGQYSGSMTINY